MSWLWKTDTNSPASFEKALSKLSTQITDASLALDVTRTRARRVKALWTLYTTLTYLAFLLIVTLVVGPKNWDVPQYIGVVGSPVVIYGVRKIVSLLFNWRMNSQQAHLNSLQKQREIKITDLKKATKYDSTQELIQRYGGTAPRETPSRSPQQTKNKTTQRAPVQRTGLAPPPTANIPGRNISPQTTPQRQSVSNTPISRSNQSPMSSHTLTTSNWDEPGFAPNAFTTMPTAARPHYDAKPNWYDRILDVLLGEDEAAVKNRLALICSNCRLVNGQAPPGIKTLEEVGKWRCSSCGTLNGKESESTKLVKEMVEKAKVEDNGGWEKVGHDDEVAEDASSNQSPTVSMEESGRDTSTAKEQDDDKGITKRVTRSSNAETPLQALE